MSKARAVLGFLTDTQLDSRWENFEKKRRFFGIASRVWMQQKSMFTLGQLLVCGANWIRAFSHKKTPVEGEHMYSAVQMNVVKGCMS